MGPGLRRRPDGSPPTQVVSPCDRGYGQLTPAGDGRVRKHGWIAAGPGTPNDPDTSLRARRSTSTTHSALPNRIPSHPRHEPVVITIDNVRVGLSVCYDIRFPALYTELARRGAQVIAVCASWGSGPGKLEQWTLLARARALDSMSYVVAAAQADPGDSLTGPGPALAPRPEWAAAWWPRRWVK